MLLKLLFALAGTVIPDGSVGDTKFALPTSTFASCSNQSLDAQTIPPIHLETCPRARNVVTAEVINHFSKPMYGDEIFKNINYLKQIISKEIHPDLWNKINGEFGNIEFAIFEIHFSFWLEATETRLIKIIESAYVIYNLLEPEYPELAALVYPNILKSISPITEKMAHSYGLPPDLYLLLKFFGR